MFSINPFVAIVSIAAIATIFVIFIRKELR
jgi:hypothetical protein